MTTERIEQSGLAAIDDLRAAMQCKVGEQAATCLEKVGRKTKTIHSSVLEETVR